MSENVVAIKKLLEVSAHYGHLARLLNPKARRFVYGQRNGISIIDLQKTVKYFREASQYVSQLCADGGHILFVGTKRQSRDLVKEHALRSQQYYMNHRWLGGTLTNHPTIRKSIHKLKKIEKMSQDGTYEKMTKKEALNLERLRQKLDINLGGIKDMPGLPKALFITDALKERTALLEANLLNIPVIAIIDTNVNPDGVDYPIFHKFVFKKILASTFNPSFQKSTVQHKNCNITQNQASQKWRDLQNHPKIRGVIRALENNYVCGILVELSKLYREEESKDKDD